MKRTSLILSLLLISGLYQFSYAQLFIGLGGTAQRIQVVDNEDLGPFVDPALADFNPQAYNKTILNVSPAVQLEYGFLEDFFLSSSVSYMWTRSHRKEFSVPGEFFGEFPEAIHRFNALVGQVSFGYAYKRFGFEIGAEAIQSLKSERSEAPIRAFRIPAVFSEPVAIDPFLHFYPRLALSYKYGKLLGVVSGTFRQNDFLRTNSSDWYTAPNASIGLSVYYIWKVSSAPKLENPRF